MRGQESLELPPGGCNVYLLCCARGDLWNLDLSFMDGSSPADRTEKPGRWAESDGLLEKCGVYGQMPFGLFRRGRRKKAGIKDEKPQDKFNVQLIFR